MQAQSSSQPPAKRRLSLSDLMYISTSLVRQGLAPGVVVTKADDKPRSSRSSASSSKAAANTDADGKSKSNAKSTCTKTKKKPKNKGKRTSNRLTEKKQKHKASRPPASTPLPCSTSSFASSTMTYARAPTATLAATIPPPVQQLLVREYDGRDFCGSADALAAWMNARWAKTGYSVGSEAVADVLRTVGRCGVVVGGGDRLGGVFVR